MILETNDRSIVLETNDVFLYSVLFALRDKILTDLPGLIVDINQWFGLRYKNPVAEVYDVTSPYRLICTIQTTVDGVVLNYLEEMLSDESFPYVCSQLTRDVTGRPVFSQNDEFFPYACPFTMIITRISGLIR